MILTADCICDAMLVNPYCTVGLGEDIVSSMVTLTISHERLIFFRRRPEIELSEAKMAFHPRLDARGRGLADVTSPSLSLTIFWEALKHDHVCHRCIGGSFIYR